MKNFLHVLYQCGIMDNKLTKREVGSIFSTTCNTILDEVKNGDKECGLD